MSSSAPFRMRLRLPSSKQETLTLPQPVTIKSLLEGIQPFVNVDVTQIELRVAYPPKNIELGKPSEWNRNVKDIGINNGEGLVVRINAESTDTSSSGAPPSNVSTKAPSVPNVAAAVPVQQSVATPPNPFVMPRAERPQTPAKRGLPATRGPSVQEEPPEVPLEGGTVVLRIMEDDNSCMFNALIYCLGKGAYEAKDLRQVVARKIREDPVRFDAATLGRSVDEYCAWISRSKSWGGEIELAVLSEYFQVGIGCVDVKTGHVYNYGESYSTRCILIYSGIHYDALAYTFIPSMPEADITVYQISPPGDPPYEQVLTAAQTMAQKLKARGYNVDTATFNIVCEQCGKGFIGEKEAIKHAEETGHTAFGQIPAEEDG